MTSSRLPRLGAVGLVSAALVVGIAPLAEAAPLPRTAVPQVALPHVVPLPHAVHVASVSKPSLRYGSRGADVKWVQSKLGVHPTSGWFGPLTRAAVTRFQKAHRGPLTRAAVTRFQRAHRLRATGTVDAATWRALTAPAPRVDARASRSTVRTALPTGARALAVAARYAGSRYRYGGTSPATGFDCSGYVGYVFGQLGVSLPRTAAAMYARVHRISASQVRPGDLVFVHKGSRISHVAIYAGGGMWWEASRPGQPVGKHRAWTRSVSYGRVTG